jgi:hypothetical protein
MPTCGYHVAMTARTRSSIIGAYISTALGLVDGATGQQDLGPGVKLWFPFSSSTVCAQFNAN